MASECCLKVQYIYFSKLLWEGVCYEHLRLINYTDIDREVSLGIALDADYADIFEVHGKKRDKHGKRLPVQRTRKELLLGYVGLDILNRVELRNLRVGSGSLDLALHRYRQDVSVNVLRKDGDVDVAISF